MFEYLDLFNKTKGRIVGLEKIDTKDYPEYAIRESLLNAIIHRDYNFFQKVLKDLDTTFRIESTMERISVEDIENGLLQDKMKVLREIDAYLKEEVYPVKLFIFIYKFINT